eukprot:m.51078 g.51078  ORF g.51078 m.51078 type:complete len:57 (+) comp7544_c0_seq1:59-229(+)
MNNMHKNSQTKKKKKHNSNKNLNIKPVVFTCLQQYHSVVVAVAEEAPRMPSTPQQL